MNRPVKGAADKAGKPKVKRKTREELEREARERKKDKKHRGHAAGSRTQEKASTDQRSGQRKAADPRIGSKKPVQLGVLDSTVAKPKPKPSAPVEKVVAAKPTMSPEEELEMLENDSRLDALLDRLDSGETLSAKDQSWVDETLDRIDILMEELGIELGDDDEEEQQEDMLQLLKRNNPKDAF
ncbi:MULTISPECIES: Der GTPase-activating protein YihI [Pectobacterium]|uniref:Der GTPase-activating protein YihI n=1 Tax=Pectobacterium TaxID=122277 RepID=UPI0015E00F13|nr:Der GTPase-activating protein YihI [Pectobacterium sp. CFBP8739]MBA0167421.1 Der GTPase-activating protein YihI [Pectobacterium sp. CFBP8739]